METVRPGSCKRRGRAVSRSRSMVLSRFFARYYSTKAMNHEKATPVTLPAPRAYGF